MTDELMIVYLQSKKDEDFLRELRIDCPVSTPGGNCAIERKTAFANIYIGWLVAKGKLKEFEEKNNINR